MQLPLVRAQAVRPGQRLRVRVRTGLRMRDWAAEAQPSRLRGRGS
jgi:hypothetical protein